MLLLCEGLASVMKLLSAFYMIGSISERKKRTVPAIVICVLLCTGMDVTNIYVCDALSSGEDVVFIMIAQSICSCIICG